MNDTTPRRTWSVTCRAILDGAVVSVHAYTVTAYRVAGQIVAALIDGVTDTVERANDLIAWAKATGTIELVEAFDGPSPIGKPIAYQLHKDLGALGVGRHYQIAGEVLGREVPSLAALTRDEAAEVWSYACSLAERPTLPSIIFQAMGA